MQQIRQASEEVHVIGHHEMSVGLHNGRFDYRLDAAIFHLLEWHSSQL